MVKAETNKQDDTLVEFRVAIYDIHMHGQRANIPLQVLDRCVLTVAVISGHPAKLKPYIGTISPIVDLYGWKKALYRSRPVDILASGGSEHA